VLYTVPWRLQGHYKADMKESVKEYGDLNKTSLAIIYSSWFLNLIQVIRHLGFLAGRALYHFQASLWLPSDML